MNTSDSIRELYITVCNDIMFEGQVDSSNILNILYDDLECHYYVIVNLTAAKYVCKDVRGVRVTSRTSVTRRVAIAWSVRRVHSQRYESPATTVIDILENPHISQIMSSAHRLRNLCAKVNGVARIVEGK